MSEDFKNQLKSIFENVLYNTEISEEQEPTNDFIHTGSDGISYSIKVEKDENEFNVFDQHGKVIDIFLPSMVDMDGGLPKAKRKEIINDYNQNHSKEEAMAEDKTIKSAFKKEYGDKGEGVYYATANAQHRNPETFKKLEEAPVVGDGCEQIEDINEEKKKWIQDAVHHKGRFTEYCKKNGFEGPCEACADLAMKSDDASVRGMAEFYRNVKK